MSDSTEESRKATTEEERLALCERLDKELDEYIDSLERKPYTEGWNPERWQEEMEQHPFFMTKTPGDDEPLPPLLDGIQQIKYDPDENTPEVLASNYKEDGNFHFKLKKYRRAVMCYTEGLKTKCNDTELKTQLYTNRAAAQYYLQNYRSSLIDCKAALALTPTHTKAIVRAALCCLRLKRHGECIEYCDRGLKDSPTDKVLLETRTKAESEKKVVERNRRRLEAKEKKEKLQKDMLLHEIKSRGITLQDESNFMHPEEAPKGVHLDENGQLVWPVLFLYPEVGQVDVIQEFTENSRFADHLETMFGEKCDRPPWDRNDAYHPDDLVVFFEDKKNQRIHAVDKNVTLLEMLKQPGYVVCNGMPNFFVFVKDSPALTTFLKENNT